MGEGNQRFSERGSVLECGLADRFVRHPLQQKGFVSRRNSLKFGIPKPLESGVGCRSIAFLHLLGEIVFEAHHIDEVELGFRPVDALFGFDDHSFH